ncbi:MAG TPA: acyl-CoA synthetase [Anaerolineaceae bacterium]|nr:acyl-CoA synthetase [Anaerolineaceae bacterium]
MQHGLTPFFAPRGVAIIGASATPNKLSYGILRNMTLYGFQGQIAPVNPKADQILGLTCYPDITSVPDPLDLAVIVLPAPAIPATLEACGQRGIRAVIIISGGFKEVGEEGAALEKQILEIAARYQMRLIGPNCVGTLDLYSGLNTTFIQGVPEKGGIGFISQSGAVGGGVVDYIRNKYIGFANFASLGNEADITETDVIEYLRQDEHTRVIAVYVEMIRDGQRFIQVARQTTPHKPIVLLKAGRTSAGARAVSSHTGSLAGSHAAYRAAFLQAGVIEAETVTDLFDISMALAHQPLPQGNRVAIITNAGGPAALLSDSLAEHGLQIADLEEQTRSALRGRLNPAAQVSNPIDMLGGAEPPEYEFALQQALADPNVDVAVVILVPQALVNPLEVAEKIVQVAAAHTKPVLTCFMGEWSVEKARQHLHSHGIPMYVFPEIPGRVLGAMLQYARWLNQPPYETVPLHGIDRNAAAQILAQAADQTALGEAQTRPLFEAYGIPLVAGEAAHSPQQAAEAARRLGFPVALKIISADILHKSDVGGIRLNLNDPQSVETAYQDMFSSIAARLPQARLEGVLVERMAEKGQEVIIGMRRDPNFGPLMMFGLGGIYVELFGDVSFRVAPLSRRDALEMIQQTHAGKLLSGFRGAEPGDLQAVVDVILRLSQLALDFPQIAEMEINPLRVFPHGVLALDGRIILS